MKSKQLEYQFKYKTLFEIIDDFYYWGNQVNNRNPLITQFDLQNQILDLCKYAPVEESTYVLNHSKLYFRFSYQ